MAQEGRLVLKYSDLLKSVCCCSCLSTLVAVDKVNVEQLVLWWIHHWSHWFLFCSNRVWGGCWYVLGDWRFWCRWWYSGGVSLSFLLGVFWHCGLVLPYRWWTSFGAKEWGISFIFLLLIWLGEKCLCVPSISADMVCRFVLYVYGYKVVPFCLESNEAKSLLEIGVEWMV